MSMSKAQIYLSAALVFALIVAVFAVQNTEKIAIKFLLWQVKEVSTVIIILASTVSGALVMLFLGFVWQYKKIKHIRLLEGELSELKKKADTIPAKEQAAIEQQ
jgi:uncharacterized integral membrane protein